MSSFFTKKNYSDDSPNPLVRIARKHWTHARTDTDTATHTGWEGARSLDLLYDSFIGGGRHIKGILSTPPPAPPSAGLPRLSVDSVMKTSGPVDSGRVIKGRQRQITLPLSICFYVSLLISYVSFIVSVSRYRVRSLSLSRFVLDTLPSFA